MVSGPVQYIRRMKKQSSSFLFWLSAGRADARAPPSYVCTWSTTYVEVSRYSPDRLFPPVSKS